MKVTVVSRIYLPEPAAASFRLGALVRALEEAGHDVVVYTTTYQGNPSTRKIRRARVLRDSTGYVRGYLQYLSFDVPAFFRILFGRKADVVVVEPPPTTGMAARAASALRRTPYVYYAADVWSDASQTTGAPRPIVEMLRAGEAWALRGARCIIAVSDGVGRRVAALAPKTVVAEVGNGIDTEIFHPDPDAVPTARPYLLYAGTASEWHGATVFVQAMPKVLAARPGARVVFVGQGAQWDEIIQSAAALPQGAVTVMPRVDGPAAAEYLQGARASLASVLPGTPYEFAFPTKAYASMACGTPVIYAGSGPAGAQITDSGFGWAVEHDIDQVAEAMIDAWDLAFTAADRLTLAGWAQQNVSAHAVALRAVQAIESAPKPESRATL